MCLELIRREILKKNKLKTKILKSTHTNRHTQAHVYTHSGTRRYIDTQA